jgi:phosphatidylethanolamine/phosphatidyl-N-methylethanolamine N-methyltransferase
LQEEVHFIKKFFLNPQSIGSVMPSSRFLGKEIADLAGLLPDYKMIELGAGTGALTKYLCDYNPVIVEIDSNLCEMLKCNFASQEIVNSCAIEYLKKVDFPCGIVISIPLINNPAKDSIIMEIRRLYMAGIVKWCILYTYGFKNPLDEVGFKKGRRHKFVLRNVPPAHIWLYE